jgi:hypothetical protein
MEEEKKMFGNIFGTIDIINEEHLDAILSTMDEKYAIYYLVESVKAAYKRGAYTIGEVEVISKAIRTISHKSE